MADHSVQWAWKFDAQTLVTEAASLLSEEGENVEYDRAIVELTTTLIGRPLDEKDDVRDMLCAMQDEMRV